MVIRDLTKMDKHLFFCNGDACKNFGAAEMTKRMRNKIIEQGLHETVHTSKTLCNGRCHDGPVIMVMPECTYYKRIKEADADEFVDKVLKQNTLWSDKLLYKWGDSEVFGEPEYL